VPLRGDVRPAIRPLFPEEWTPPLTPDVERLPDAIAERWQVLQSLETLGGKKIEIEGLPKTSLDVLVRIEHPSGESYTKILRPNEPGLVIPEGKIRPTVSAFFGLGVEHILFGFDHLFFVTALLLIVRSRWTLFKTVTSFTVAHSLTLALASLGVLRVPSPPVEAGIAASIVFVAAEAVRARRGEIDLAAKNPWLVAFVFGLLHGLGFAGALSEVGLPQGTILPALLLFNLGVELGQLLFVAAVLVLAALAKRLRRSWPSWSFDVPAYAIGSVAVLWFLGRCRTLF
jgi:hydrogenase/urease accessory protein HupE